MQLNAPINGAINRVIWFGLLCRRGLAKLKKGDTMGGNADIATDKAIKSDVAEDFAR
jgi:hypothetical protein